MVVAISHKLDVVSSGKNVAKVQMSICSGFFCNAAQKDPQEGYKTLVDNQTVFSCAQAVHYLIGNQTGIV